MSNDPLKNFLEPQTLTKPIDGEPVILVENGNIFDGTFAHWEECFFKFQPGDSLAQKTQDINEYCQHQGWNVDYIWTQ